MRNTAFETEFNKRFRDSNLKIQKSENDKDYYILNEPMSKEVLVRTVFPDEKYLITQWRKPAPFLNVEVVLWFHFKTDDTACIPDYMSFIYDNPALKRTDFLIINTDELKECLHKISGPSGKGQIYKMLIWIFPGDFVFVATNLSCEGEWYLLGNATGFVKDSLAAGSERDFSKYLNQWDLKMH